MKNIFFYLKTYCIRRIKVLGNCERENSKLNLSKKFIIQN